MAKKIGLYSLLNRPTGQIMVEYVLFFTVIFALVAALFPRLKGLFEVEADCQGQSISVACLYQQTFGANQRFKYYTIRP